MSDKLTVIEWYMTLSDKQKGVVQSCLLARAFNPFEYAHYHHGLIGLTSPRTIRNALNRRIQWRQQLGLPIQAFLTIRDDLDYVE